MRQRLIEELLDEPAEDYEPAFHLRGILIALVAGAAMWAAGIYLVLAIV